MEAFNVLAFSRTCVRNPTVYALAQNSVGSHRPRGTLWAQRNYPTATESFPKSVMGHERIRALSDTWQHAIAAAGGERRGPTFRGVLTTPSNSTADLRAFFDRCAATGSPEQHGDAQRLLEYRLALVRRLARPCANDVVLDLGCGHGQHLLALAPQIAGGIGIDVSPRMIDLARTRLQSACCKANIAFEVGDAERLEPVADQSIDLAICIGALEHMLDKRAVLASIHRALKFGGRFFCLTLDADYVWYRVIAPRLGYATKHLSSDQILTRGEFGVLLHQAGFGGVRFAPWTFIPRGDVSAPVASLLTVLDAAGRLAGADSLRGGLSVCAWKPAKSPHDSDGSEL